jgi:chorismate mutase/prephenate dehydratase
MSDTPPPTIETPTLETLRARIDEIDDSIHALIVKRAQVVREIGEVKRGSPEGDEKTFLRPGREASILRRLATRHEGEFPLPELTRMWREMLAGFTRMQGNFMVSVCLPGGPNDLWDLARDHFGSHTPISTHTNPLTAFRAVLDGPATVAVLPWPEDGHRDPWWRALISEDAKAPRIVARLPFVVTDRLREGPTALVVARIAPEATGDDRSFLTVELVEDVSRSRLKLAAEGAGMPALAFWTSGVPMPERPLVLMEVSGHVQPRDPKLQAMRTALGDAVRAVRVVGGYAMPLTIDHKTGKS